MSTEPFADQYGASPADITPSRTPAAPDVRAELAKILTSDPFIRSQRIKRLLEFLVESLLAGNRDYLKESLVGVEVFDRRPDYDSKQDPVVRVEMRRLRSKLSEYYLHEGKTDGLIIWLDKGSYIPVLSIRDQVVLDAAAPADQDVSTPAAGRKKRLPRLLLWSTAFAIALLVTAAAVGFLRSPAKPTQSLRLFPMTGNAGLEMSPAFSPDGKQLAYSWDGNRRNLNIYVKPVQSDRAPRRLTDNAAHDIHPAWSPDGQRIAFLRIFPEKSQLLVIPSSGGVETVISEAAPAVTRWHPVEPEGDGTNGPVWSPDGSYLLIIGHATAGPSKIVQRIFLDGRQQPLTNPPVGENDTTPSISPSGKRIAFLRNWASNSSDIFLMDSRGGGEVRITFDSHDIQGLAWLDSDHLIYSSDRRGNFRLWQVAARAGALPQLFAAGGARPQWPALSQDGHWLAFVDSVSEASIWQLSLHGDDTSVQPEQVISSAGADSSPAYSPDGKRIAFVSDRSGTRQIWISDSDGTQVRQLTDFPGSTVGTPRWSRDSRRLVFDASLEGRSAIWIIDDDGANLHRLNKSTAREYMPSWSNDGRWIYFCSLRNGQDQLWKQRPDTGQSMQLTQGTFFDAVEYPAGNVVYAERRQGGIWQMPLGGGTPTPVAELSGINPARYWALAGETLYFLRQENPPRELDALDLRTRRISKLFDIPGELLAGTPGIAIDPKMHSLLFVQQNQTRSSILLQER